jgi:hypothetical protein
VDGLVLPFLVGAWWARLKERHTLVGVLIGAATAIKLYPAILLPALWPCDHPRGRWRMPLAFLATLSICYLPYVLRSGVGVLGFLPQYLHETFNLSPLVLALDALFNRLGFDPRQALPLLALAVLALLSLWIVLNPSRDRLDLLRRSAWLILAVTLLSQNLFSWYMLWLLPLLPVFLLPLPHPPTTHYELRTMSPFWLGLWLFCALAPFSYSFFIDWKPVPIFIWLQFLPLYLLLIIDLVTRLWKKRPSLSFPASL